MDISLKRVEIDRRGKDGLICRDKHSRRLKVTFFVRVNKTIEHVLQVAQTIGVKRASDEAPCRSCSRRSRRRSRRRRGMNFEDLYKERKQFRGRDRPSDRQDLSATTSKTARSTTSSRRR